MMIRSYRQHLISSVDAFIARTGMKPSIFGLKALNDGKFIKRLHDGQNVTLSNADRVLDFICSHSPRDRQDDHDQPQP